MTTVNKVYVDSSKKDNIFYDVTNQLSKNDLSNIRTEWKEIENAFPTIENSMTEDIDGIIKNLDDFKDNVLPVFDVAITSLEIMRVVYQGIGNLMSLVVDYIYQMIYNQLDMLIRSGVYSLTVTPDFQDTNGLSLPVTSLPEQAENIYKKFYDFKDPNVPYNLNYSTDEADKLMDEGNRFIERLDAIYSESDENVYNKYVEDNKNASIFSLTDGVDKPHFKSDFEDTQKRLNLLLEPGGTYEGIFLYFSFDLKQNLKGIKDFVDALSKFSFFFDSKQLNRTRNQLAAKKRKKIRVITRRQFALVNTEADGNFTHYNEFVIRPTTKYEYEKEMPHTKAHAFDPKLKDLYFILPYQDTAHGISTSIEGFGKSVDAFHDYATGVINGIIDELSVPKVDGKEVFSGLGQDIKEIWDLITSPETYKSALEEIKELLKKEESDYEPVFHGGVELDQDQVRIDRVPLTEWLAKLDELISDWASENEDSEEEEKEQKPNNNLFDEIYKATIISCSHAEKQEDKAPNLYYRYIDRLHGNFAGDGTEAAEEEYYVYDIEIEIPRNTEEKSDITGPKTNIDFFNDTQRIGIFRLDKLIGYGYVVETMPKEISVENTRGSWFGTTFTDLIGITDNIKSLQNYVAGSKFQFDTNLAGLDELIDYLKSLRKDIVRMIDMLETIISLLNIQIKFSGKIHAKYVREENYDKFTSYLTDYSNAPPTFKQIFKPSANAIIRDELVKIKELQRLNPNIEEINQFDVDKWIEEIDEEYGNDNPERKESDFWFDQEFWGETEDVGESGKKIVNSEIAKGGLIAGPVVVQQLGKAVVNNVTELGSAAWGLVEKYSDYVAEENPQTHENKIKERTILWNDVTSNEHIVKQKFNDSKIKIKAEINRINGELSSEFGFSQVFVTYLPDAVRFRPVATLAEVLELTDQNDTKPETEDITNIDRTKFEKEIEGLKPKNTIADSKQTLKVESEKENASSGFKEKARPPKISISPIVPFYQRTELQNKEGIQVTGLSFQINRNNKNGDKIDFSAKYYGVRSEQGLIIPIPEDNADKYKYIMKATLTAKITGSSYTGDDRVNRPRLSKIEVKFGLQRKINENSEFTLDSNTIKKFEGVLDNNGTGDSIFRFGQLNTKNFTVQIEISKDELGKDYEFYPYFTIGYKAIVNTPHFFGEGTVFTLEPEIELYRTN